MPLPFHQHLFPPAKKLIRKFSMLQDNDHVAVGVSGGKDSLTTLYTMANLRRSLPINYKLTAISIDMGWPGGQWEPLQKLCDELNVPLEIVRTEIAQVLFEIRKESNPCSLCSKMRHGALNDAALELGCNVVALGHHRDDAIETVFMNMMYNGRIACFHPVTWLDRKGLRLIRPMLHVSEKTTTMVAGKLELPVQHNPCPANGNSKRQHIKDLLASQAKLDPVIPNRLLTAVGSLWEKPQP